MDGALSAKYVAADRQPDAPAVWEAIPGRPQGIASSRIKWSPGRVSGKGTWGLDLPCSRLAEWPRGGRGAFMEVQTLALKLDEPHSARPP